MNTLGLSSPQSHILVVDDDPPVRTLLSRVLQTEGYEIISTQDGMEAVESIRGQRPALIILDINLPKLNGFEVCRQTRKVSQVPIIIISGRGTDEDKVHAFELGADDYVTKPFSPIVLTSRVRAVLRRSAAVTIDQNHSVFRYADIEIDFSARRIQSCGRDVRTTPIEFDLLRILVLNLGKVLTHQMSLSQVWGPEYGSEREYLRVHLSHLRRKIEPDPSHPRYIQTVPRIGYRFATHQEEWGRKGRAPDSAARPSGAPVNLQGDP